MVKQLLAFARKGVTRKQRLSAAEFIQEVIDTYRASMPENIKFSYIHSNESMILEADKMQSRQVLLNLIDNAKDAVADTPRPEITVRSSAYIVDQAFLQKHQDVAGTHFLRISVADNGCGISDKDFENIFEPFYTTKEVGKGTGLGLPMVFGTIKSHGGAIEVESTPGKGTVFTIYCPMYEPEPEGQKSEGQSTPDKIVSGNGETILVVDDDRVVIDTARMVLTKLGYRVLTAAGGREGVDIYRQQWPDIDLVMLDVVMPEVGGIEACRLMRKIHAPVKIIFVTGYDRGDALQDSIDQGGEIVLRKPYTISQLSLTLHTVFNAD